jgi:hypothetical protein
MHTFGRSLLGSTPNGIKEYKPFHKEKTYKKEMISRLRIFKQ